MFLPTYQQDLRIKSTYQGHRAWTLWATYLHFRKYLKSQTCRVTEHDALWMSDQGSVSHIFMKNQSKWLCTKIKWLCTTVVIVVYFYSVNYVPQPGATSSNNYKNYFRVSVQHACKIGQKFPAWLPVLFIEVKIKLQVYMCLNFIHKIIVPVISSVFCLLTTTWVRGQTHFHHQTNCFVVYIQNSTWKEVKTVK